MENKSTQYQYMHVELEDVMRNIDEYIIPECQEACKLLWGKNIETFMVSNREDNHLYVLLEQLSDENKERMKKLIEECPDFYFFDEWRHYYGIKTDGTTKLDEKTLAKLVRPFLMQDILKKRYQTAEEFLDDYKTFSIHDIQQIMRAYNLSNSENVLQISESGNVGIKPEYLLNPERANSTLEEALKDTGKRELYDETEGIVYCSRTFMDWHKRYVESKLRNNSNKAYEKEI